MVREVSTEKSYADILSEVLEHYQLYHSLRVDSGQGLTLDVVDGHFIFVRLQLPWWKKLFFCNDRKVVANISSEAIYGEEELREAINSSGKLVGISFTGLRIEVIDSDYQESLKKICKSLEQQLGEEVSLITPWSI